MVDSVTNTAMSSLLRSLNVGTQRGVSGVKNDSKASQAIVQQLQQTASESKLASASATPSSTSGSATLPRGSLVDVVV